MRHTPAETTIAILGGTGKEGRGLAYRWAKAGYRLLIGSRDAGRAGEAALEIQGLLGRKGRLTGATNLEAARAAEIVVLTVPYTAHRATLESVAPVLEGKLLVDVTVPLHPPKVTQVQMPPAGSAAQEAREVLGEGTRVTSAFQNISHEHLLQEAPLECDVLVTGTSREARLETLELVEAAGLRGWDAGPLENSVVVEGLTSILIGINKQYGGGGAGIRITGTAR